MVGPARGTDLLQMLHKNGASDQLGEDGFTDLKIIRGQNPAAGGSYDLHPSTL